MDARDEGSALVQYIAEIWDPRADLGSHRLAARMSPLPLVIKGILTAEDARRAVDRGAAAIVVSNHGGRQLDCTRQHVRRPWPKWPTRWASDVELLVDGGIRRGSDILKALALGARAVLVGRPYLWALAVGGQSGVEHMLELLRSELDLAMALSGRPTIASIDRTLLGSVESRRAASSNGVHASGIGVLLHPAGPLARLELAGHEILPPFDLRCVIPLPRCLRR